MELLAVPIFIFFLFAVISFSTKPHLAVGCILILSVLNAWFIEPPSVKIGLNIYLFDLVFIPLFISTLIRLSLKSEWPNSSPPWIIVGLLIFLNLYIGLKQNGTAAGVEVRSIFYYWSGAFYFMTFAYSKEMIDKIIKYWLLICFALMLVVYFRFVAEALHLPISKTWIAADPTGVRFRVVNSSHAYLLGVCVVILFHRYILPEATIKPSRPLILLFAFAVIALQHRSVWAASLTGILLTVLLPGIKKHKLVARFAIIGLLGGVMIFPLLYLGHLDNFIDSISGSAMKATNLHTGTFGGRLMAWERIMTYWEKQSFFNQLLGDPFGGGYAGLSNSPHNFFFQSLLRVGVLGNFLISFFYIGVLIRLYFKLFSERNSRFYPSLFFMIIAGQMAFYIPYAPEAEHGILLGIAASLAKRKIKITKPEELKNQYYLKPLANNGRLGV